MPQVWFGLVWFGLVMAISHPQKTLLYSEMVFGRLKEEKKSAFLPNILVKFNMRDV